MTKTLDKGEDKIQQICDKLKLETLQPAQSEAAKIIENAETEAKKILQAAEAEAAKLIVKGQETLAKERGVFETSLKQASSQCFESLKQTIQRELFNDKLGNAVDAVSSGPETIAKVLTALIAALEKDGTSVSLQAVLPKSVSAREVNAFLAKDVLEKLENQPYELGDFSGGAKVKLLDKKLTLDLSDKVLKELLGRYLREDFRDLLFQA